MGEIVNLRQARKRAARGEREAAAERNRISHGTGKAERKAAEARSLQANRFLDGHLRAPSPPEKAK